jgi:hypothetical protein
MRYVIAFKHRHKFIASLYEIIKKYKKNFFVSAALKLYKRVKDFLFYFLLCILTTQLTTSFNNIAFWAIYPNARITPHLDPRLERDIALK